MKFESLKVVQESQEDGGDKTETKTNQPISEIKVRDATIIDYLQDVKLRAEKAQLPTHQKRGLTKIASKKSSIS